MKKILNEDKSDIYGNDAEDEYLVADDIDDIHKSNIININTVTNGLITTVNINGKNIDIVNPLYIAETQRIINSLVDKIYKLEIRCSIISNSINNMNRKFSIIDNKLDRKIDRD